MSTKRSEYSGRFKKEYPDEYFIQSVKSRSTPSTAREVAEDIGCNQRIAADRLDKIVESGRLQMKRAGFIKTYFVSTF